jgi:hypothetical protein
MMRLAVVIACTLATKEQSFCQEACIVQCREDV